MHFGSSLFVMLEWPRAGGLLINFSEFSVALSKNPCIFTETTLPNFTDS